MAASSAFDFDEAGDNRTPGLWWLKKQGKLFDARRPIIITIHGFTTTNNTWMQSSRFQSWNMGVFCWVVGGGWQDNRNIPIHAYQGKAEELFQCLKSIIEQKYPELNNEEYNNNEIRLAGYSWGTHVASYAAMKLLRYVRSREDKSILVSVDLMDPVPDGLKIEDDEGNTRWAANHVKVNLNYVTDYQFMKAAISPTEALFTIVIQSRPFGIPGGDWFSQTFPNDILPSIKENVEVFPDSTPGADVHHYTRVHYRDCVRHDYDDVKYVTRKLAISLGQSGGTTSPAPGTYKYIKGARVTVTASPASGWKFDHWGGNISGKSPAITITLDSDESITAYFERIPTIPYIANRRTKEIHNSDCIWVTRMKDTNKVPCSHFDQVAILIENQGYNGCYYCLPRYDRDTLSEQQVLNNLEEDLGQ